MKISNKAKNKIKAIYIDFKDKVKNQATQYIDLHKGKGFKISFLIMIFIFVSAQIYSISNWKNASDVVIQKSQETTQNSDEEIKIEEQKITYVEFTKDKLGYRTETPFAKDVSQDGLAILILLACAFMPFFYLPYFLSPFLALSLAALTNIYMSCDAIVPLVIIAVAIKILAYSYTIAIGGVIYNNEKNKYKYKSLKGYNSYDFRAVLQNIFGTKEKADKVLKEKDKKVKIAKEKVKKIGIENIVYALLIALILLSIAKVIFMFSV